MSRAKPFKGSIFVGLRNGILFICPAKENMISINHMFNDAGFFAKENPGVHFLAVAFTDIFSCERIKVFKVASILFKCSFGSWKGGRGLIWHI